MAVTKEKLWELVQAYVHAAVTYQRQIDVGSDSAAEDRARKDWLLLRHDVFNEISPDAFDVVPGYPSEEIPDSFETSIR